MIAKSENGRINVDALEGIGEHLEALSIANKTIDAIQGKIDIRGEQDIGWLNRAKGAHKAWGKVRRRITERLAVLRQEEKELNKMRMKFEDEELLKLLRNQVAPAEWSQSRILARALADERLNETLDNAGVKL
ncbi:hypothetical protein [Rahnella inusitata]|uniref:hypothetical protein n=1 Tax=Rahnella inusitata TaxID=58169 RepID=UPI0039AF968F